MRIGIFGGSFDPVHVGHLWIAEAAIESLSLDHIRWIPASVSPLKPDGPKAPNDARLQMLRLAVSGCENHIIDDRELRRGDVSFSVDTVAEMQVEFPRAELFLVIGSDSLATIRQWHQPQRLLELALPAVVQRGGEPEIDLGVLEGLVDQPRLAEIRRHVISMSLIEISSRDMRARIAKGRPIRFRVPRAVEAFLEAEGLYRQ